MNVGDHVGWLTIISGVEPLVERRNGRTYSRRRWLCSCQCGSEKIIRDDSLKRGFTQSCGCMQRLACTKHGHWANGKPSGTYKTWESMRSRCNTSSDEHYPQYGARGITICDRWEKFENFLNDMGERPRGKTLDRMDVNGNYEPSNCRWATAKQQGRNRRNTVFVTYKGERLPLISVCEKLGKPYPYAVSRLKANKPPRWMAEECVSP